MFRLHVRIKRTARREAAVAVRAGKHSRGGCSGLGVRSCHLLTHAVLRNEMTLEGVTGLEQLTTVHAAERRHSRC